MKLERFPGINIIVEEKRVIFELKIKNQNLYICATHLQITLEILRLLIA